MLEKNQQIIANVKAGKPPLNDIIEVKPMDDLSSSYQLDLKLDTGESDEIGNH